jgi:uncharacterized protein
VLSSGIGAGRKGLFLLNLLVDADACPVKPEVYRVAGRYGLAVTLVANKGMAMPAAPERGSIELVVVGGQLNAADDWIVEHAAAGDIVVSGDIPLAARCLEKGARVIAPNGRVFTRDNIGEILATRDLMSQLRDFGAISGGGPPPFTRKDRSYFLQRLDETIQAIRRGN